VSSMNTRLVTALTSLVAAFWLVGCAPTQVHQTERGRNIQACEEMASVYREMYKAFDSDSFGDPESYLQGFFDRQVEIGRLAESPMGTWMAENAEAARAHWAAGDTADVEAKGQAANNGEAVKADEGSLEVRCSALGVDLP
jgi:tellurite resistance protein